ncbi:branched-chain amino acid transport system II carrier protein [Paraclostridium sordellii]|uniref:branched-chain amino acid transport system II carrier protein n=1 Tax=Paraclostridium sordellii TaxID=1505 RepID=UPI00096A85F6|nr:branched-chain amino acid transport system II carrier protein [Paeniclostridium sordellii]
MKKQYLDTLVIGFALFAMFFGAGNLIFPPYLGVVSGEYWLLGFCGFVLADVGLALLAILAAAKCDGDISRVLSRSGKTLSKILATAIMICLGPLLAIPRTGATTFEMGIAPIFNGFSPVLFSVIFFGLTIILTIKPSKVVDIIGEYLTPALLVALVFLIIMGIVSPLGDLNQPQMIEGIFAEGIAQGYQTMDPLGAIALSAVVIISITQKGYKKESQKVKITLQAGIIAGVALFIVYGGLTYLGSTVAHQFKGINPSDINQTALIVGITEQLLGYPGKIVLAIIVGLACLTTSIGLVSATGQYFTKMSNGKVKYETIVIGVCIFSAVVANFGVSAIIKFASPILTVIYPATIVLVLMTLFNNKIKNDNTFKGATYVALIISVLTVIDNMGVNVAFIEYLPFYKLGFNWIIPTIIGGIIGSLIKQKEKEEIN